MVYVNWNGSLAYCKWLSEMTGQNITLPSEAEWEKVARGYQDARRYPWGDEFDSSRCNSKESGLGMTTPVGIFPGGASPYDALDMIGNVWEWTRSDYGVYPYDGDDGRESLAVDIDKVVRGGWWYDRPKRGESASRLSYRAYQGVFNVGFRVVCAVDDAMLVKE